MGGLVPWALSIRARLGEVQRLDLVTDKGRSIFAHDFAGAPDPHLPVYAIFEHAAHDIWVGTSDGLFVGPHQAGKGFFPVSALAGLVVHSIAQDANGRLWIGTASGLIRTQYTTGAKNVRVERRYRTKKGLPDEVVKTLLTAPDGQLWIGTTSGLAKLINADTPDRCFQPFAVTGGLSYGDIESISRDSEGN